MTFKRRQDYKPNLRKMSLRESYVGLPRGESIIPCDLDEVSGVIEREDTNVTPAADLESIHSAIRCDQPGSLLRAAMDRTEQVQRHKADHTSVGKDRDPLMPVCAEYIMELFGDPLEQMPVALAAGDDVIYVAIDEGEIIIGMQLLRLVKGEALEYADVPLSEFDRSLDIEFQ